MCNLLLLYSKPPFLLEECARVKLCAMIVLCCCCCIFHSTLLRTCDTTNAIRTLRMHRTTKRAARNDHNYMERQHTNNGTKPCSYGKCMIDIMGECGSHDRNRIILFIRNFALLVKFVVRLLGARETIAFATVCVCVMSSPQ